MPALKHLVDKGVTIVRFFPFHFVVLVNVAVLTQSVRVELFVLALPGFFGAPVLVITIVAHPFGVMLPVVVSAVDILFFTN